jgi:hypothetical protein
MIFAPMAFVLKYIESGDWNQLKKRKSATM